MPVVDLANPGKVTTVEAYERDVRILVFFLMLSFLAACSSLLGPSSVQGTHQVTFQPASEDGRAPIDPQDVVFYTRHDLPPGFELDRYKFEMVPEFPSPEDPHQILGRIKLQERANVGADEAMKSVALTTQRNTAIRQEAANHGANGVLEVGDQWFPGRRAEHRATYYALHISSAPRAYPEVNALLEKLALPEGYREIQRSTHQLEDLPETTFDVRLKRGHCYVLAMAFPPGEVDRPRQGADKVTPINFKVALPKAPQIPGYRVINASAGGFGRYRDNPKDGKSWHRLDGVWSRAGAGEIRCPVINTQVGSVSFFTRQGALTKNPPPFNPGTGTAELVIYERRLPPAEAAKKICGKCYHAYETCHPRKPLATCKALTECLPTVGMSVGACASVWGK